MQIWRDLSADGWIRKDGGLVVVRQILCDTKNAELKLSGPYFIFYTFLDLVPSAAMWQFFDQFYFSTGKEFKRRRTEGPVTHKIHAHELVNLWWTIKYSDWSAGGPVMHVYLSSLILNIAHMLAVQHMFPQWWATNWSGFIWLTLFFFLILCNIFLTEIQWKWHHWIVRYCPELHKRSHLCHTWSSNKLNYNINHIRKRENVNQLFKCLLRFLVEWIWLQAHTVCLNLQTEHNILKKLI